jgi:hypothetical protein
MQNNLRKRDDLGLEYLRIKKELAMDLPLALLKKVKQVIRTSQVTPIANISQLKDKSSNTVAHSKKKVTPINLD